MQILSLPNNKSGFTTPLEISTRILAPKAVDLLLDVLQLPDDETALDHKADFAPGDDDLLIEVMQLPDDKPAC